MPPKVGLSRYLEKTGVSGKRIRHHKRCKSAYDVQTPSHRGCCLAAEYKRDEYGDISEMANLQRDYLWIKAARNKNIHVAHNNDAKTYYPDNDADYISRFVAALSQKEPQNKQNHKGRDDIDVMQRTPHLELKLHIQRKTLL